MKNLMYFCVFHNRDYIKLASILLGSLKLFTRNLENIDILVLTSLDFKQDFLDLSNSIGLKLNFKFFVFNTIPDAAMARLYIYDYESINYYDKILYLDTDIIIQNDLNIFFNQDIENKKVYALPEDTIYREDFGGWYFDISDEMKHKIMGINSGILLWKNMEKIKDIFNNIINHIALEKKNPRYGRMPKSADQPFINYHLIKNGNYDVKLITKYALLYPKTSLYPKQSDIILCHFAWPFGDPKNKKERMSQYMSSILNSYTNVYKSRTENVSIQEYQEILVKNNHIFKRLEEICVEIGEPVEGNCFFKDQTINEKIDELIYKQLNLYSLGRTAKNILEIGFNTGHSALLFLISNPESKLTCFDIVSHKYTMPCFEYLNSLFPGRINLIAGDSTITVPEFYKVCSNINKFDLMNIQGCHYGEIPKKDLDNCLKMLDKDGILIFDDTQVQHINTLLEQNLDKMYEIKLYDTIMYQHRIFQESTPFYSKYTWGDGNGEIELKQNCELITTWGNGYYKILDKNVVFASWDNYNHVLLFDEDKNSFVSFRIGDTCITHGEKYNFFQTHDTKYGKVTIYRNDIYINDSFRQGKYWDEETLLKLKKYIDPSKNILEIGGHIGTSSIIYSSFLDKNSKYYVYEPQKEMFNLLVKNINQNNLTDKIYPVNKGVFCYNGLGRMNNIDLDGGGRLVEQAYKDDKIKCNFGGLCVGSKGDEINFTTIDNMDIDNIGFIHCDAQGSENFIFSKAIETIKKFRPVIFYENMELFGKYLYNTVCYNYPKYSEEKNFNLKEYCINILGYETCIDRFNGGIDTLLIPKDVSALPVMSEIPKIFFQTSKQPLDPYVKELIKSNLNSNWEYLHFVDNDIINFFIKNPDREFPNIIYIFNKIKWGQHKADFFRYYFLYKKGGVFMDSDAMIYDNIENIVKDTTFFSSSSYCNYKYSKTVFQGVIGCVPNHPFIYAAFKNFYNLDVSILDKDNYLYLCNDLYYIITTNMPNEKYILYNEIFITQFNYFNITNNDNKVLFKHFHMNKNLNKEYLDSITL